jgi:hypothetical protein
MHVLRSLYVFFTFAAIILIARIFLFPADFGIHENGYTYGWYRHANVEDGILLTLFPECKTGSIHLLQGKIRDNGPRP